MVEAFLWWLFTFLLTDYFRPDLPEVTAQGEGDFQAPTATEGRKIPQVPGGTVRIKGPNVLWQGDWDAEPITIETGVVFKRDEVVGYKYKIALALGQFIGRCYGISGIWIGDDKVWDYVEDNSSVIATVVDLDLPDLFGGEKSGGGFQGRIRCFTGSNSQPVSSFLASRVPLQSAWPGLTYIMLTDSTETEGAIIGESNTLRDLYIEFQTHSTIAQGGLGNELGLLSDKHIIGRDANPVSVAYRVLNSSDWGINTNEINVGNFQTVADTCYTEGIGFSMTIDSEQEAYKVIDDIEKHIDGYIGPNPTNGLIEIKLARYDYDPATEFQANTTNIKALSNYSKPEWPQTQNEVKVRFANRDKHYKDDHAVAQDMAARIITNRPQSATVRYPGIRDPAVANRVVSRLSRTYFWPKAKFEMTMDRTAYGIRPGDVVVVTHPDINAVNLITRVIRVRTGDPIKQEVKLDVIVDVFRDEVGLQAAPPQTEYEPPPSNPVAFGTQSPIEFKHITPPRFLLRALGVEEEARPFLALERIKPNTSWEFNFRTRGTPFGGNFSPVSGWFSGGEVSTFASKGYLRTDMPQLQANVNDGTASTANGGGMFVDGPLSAVVGSYTPQNTADQTGTAVISPDTSQEEWVTFKTAVVDGAGIECTGMIRALGHKAQKKHFAGEPVYFINTNAAGPYLMENPRPDQTDDAYSMQIQIATKAPGGTSSFVNTSEFAIRYDLIKNYPDAPVRISIYDPNGTTQWGGNWFPDGVFIEADRIYQTNNPSIAGFYITGRYRRTDVVNATFAANGYRDDYSYGTNMNADMKPTLHWWIYNLDVTPNPTQGTDAVLSGTNTTADDLDNSSFVNWTDIHAAIDAGENIPAHGSFNARFELAYSNQGSPIVDGVLSGVLSDFVRVDNTLDYTHAPTHPIARFYTKVLLHFNSTVDGATTASDASLYYAPVTFSGNASIRTNTSPQPSPTPSPELPPNIVGSGFLEIIPDTVSPNPSPGTWVEVADVSPRQFADIDVKDPGMTIQFKVWFTEAPGASTGEYPLVTKWRESDNERQFWVGMVNNTLTLRWSLNGTTVTSNSDAARTWNAGQWYDVVVDVTNELQWSSQCRIFYWRDGAFLGIDFPSQSLGGPLHDSQAPLRIGADGDGNQCPATVYLDEVRILETKPYRIGFTPSTDPFPGNEYAMPLLMTFQNATVGARSGTTDDGTGHVMHFGTNDPGSPQTQIVEDSPFTSSPASTSPSGKALYCSGAATASGFEYVGGVWLENTGGADANGPLFNVGTGAFSWELFVKFHTIPSSNWAEGSALIGCYHRTGAAPWWDYWWTFTNSNQMQFAYLNSSNVQEINVTAPPVSPFVTEQWYHCAVCRDDSNNFAMFMDGQRIHYTSPMPNFNLLHHDSGKVGIGRFYVVSTGSFGRYRASHATITNVRMLNGSTAYDPNQATLTIPTDYF